MATTTQPQTQGPATVSLTKRGDVILVLDKGSEIATKLLVSSAFLSEASHVFEKMFSGRYAEGSAPSLDNPGEVHLPDDDPACMLLLCRIIHMQTTKIPRQLDICVMADFAILCDKYDCIDAVQPWSRIWIMEFLSNPHLKRREKLLMVTYVLDLPEEFSKVTQSLFRYDTFLIDIASAAHGTDLIPKEVFARLQKGQLYYQAAIVKCLDIDHVADLIDSCVQGQMLYFSYITQLRCAGLWPTKVMTLQEYRNGISRMKDPVTYPCKDPWCKCHRNTTIRFKLLEAMDRVIDSVQGICLDCVCKSGAKSVEVQCRVKHSPAKY